MSKGRGRPSHELDISTLSDDHQRLYNRKLQIEEQLKLYKAPSKGDKDDMTSGSGRVSAHWDNVMKEMAWLAADFSREKNAHSMSRKKVTRMVVSYHTTLESKKAKKAKEEVLDLRKRANRMAKDVRKFWLKIDRIIAFKQKAESDEVRQKVNLWLLILVAHTIKIYLIPSEYTLHSLLSFPDASIDDSFLGYGQTFSSYN